MPVPPRSNFVFALCQKGAERAVRDEFMQHGLSPAFGVDGFVSAKSRRSLGVDELPPLVLGRRVALSLGKVRRDGEGDGTDSVDVAAVVRDTGAILQREEGDRGESAGDNDDGRFIVSVVDRPGGSFVGIHRHRPGLSPDPGGDPRLEVPDNAPSRAWLKLEEANRIMPLPIGAGDVVVEVGCAPGGQTRALLDRGCIVVGVDPNRMDERVAHEPTFKHLQCSASHVDADLLRRTLPGPARFIVVDINQRPLAALSSVSGIIGATKDTLRGGVFTLKLGDWALMRELPSWRSRLEGMFGGAVSTWATQLPANRQELTVVVRRTT